MTFQVATAFFFGRPARPRPPIYHQHYEPPRPALPSTDIDSYGSPAAPVVSVDSDSYGSPAAPVIQYEAAAAAEPESYSAPTDTVKVKKSIVNDIDIDGYGSPVAPVISSYSPATDDSTVKVKKSANYQAEVDDGYGAPAAPVLSAANSVAAAAQPVYQPVYRRPSRQIYKKSKRPASIFDFMPMMSFLSMVTNRKKPKRHIKYPKGSYRNRFVRMPKLRMPKFKIPKVKFPTKLISTPFTKKPTTTTYPAKTPRK